MSKLFAAIVLLLIAGCSPQSVSYRLIRYGDSDINDFKKFPSRKIAASQQPFRFKTDTSKQSFIAAKFEAALAEKNTLGFLVIKDNAIVYERYFENYKASDNIQSFSVSKSITSLLIGCAIDDKLISSENDLVIKYIPELASRGFDNITILDLLQMQAPVHYTENSNPFGRHARLYYTAHVEKEMLKLTANPEGKRKFVYRSGESQLLGLVLKRVLAPKNITAYLQEKMWTPLGMESNAEWTIDNDDTTGIEKTFCCLATTARDLSKIGLLYLNNGKWKGKQIVAEKWVEKSLAPLSDKNREMVYSYNWWLYPGKNVFVAIGKDGQFIYVKPDKKIVIVRMGKNMAHTKREKWFKMFEEIAAQL